MIHGRLSWAAAAMLAAGLAGCGSTVIASTGGTSSGGVGGATEACDAGPAGVVAMLDDEPMTLAVIGGDVYVGLFSNGIVAVPRAGGAVQPIVPSVDSDSDNLQNAFVFDQENLYWAESSGGDTSGPIARAAISGGTTTVLASSVGFTAGVAVDAQSVYWVDQDQGTVNRVPLGGGSASVLTTGLATPGGLALHADTLYLTDAAGDLVSVPAGGGSVKTLFTGPGVPPNVQVADYSPALIADDANVYFVVCHWDGTAGQTLYRFPLDGSGPATALVTSPVSQCAVALAVDATDLYWAEDTIIKAMPIAGGATRVVATSSQSVAAGPAVDACNVYWGVTPDDVTCGLCPPPPTGQINAVMRAPKSGP